MARPLTRAQALENRAFLKLLRKTDNVRLACRELGLKYGTMQDRRRKHPAFAVKWDAALVFAAARFEAVGVRGPAAGRPRCSPLRPLARKNPSTSYAGPPPREISGRMSPYRTSGGEMTIVRCRDGRLQMRRALPGKITREGEQAYLAALSATCNKRLASAAVGAAENAFNRRRRKDPGFAREVRMALEEGYEALEMALYEGCSAAAHEHDDWRHNDPPAIPPMSVSQALQLMYLHQKEARLIAEPDCVRRRPGESREVQSARLTAMYEERQRRAREAFEVAEAERWERGEPAWGPAGEAVRAELGLGPRFRGDDEGRGPSTAFGGPPPLEIEGRIRLPDLAQVTGWSRADPAKVAHHPERALFGGWRIEDMEKKG